MTSRGFWTGVAHIDALFGPLDLTGVGDLRPHKPLRIFAGQADPEDTAHFTIDYESAGERGTLDGFVRDLEVAADGTPLPVMQLVPRQNVKLTTRIMAS